jgi:hypothetical protein
MTRQTLDRPFKETQHLMCSSLDSRRITTMLLLLAQKTAAHEAAYAAVHGIINCSFAFDSSLRPIFCLSHAEISTRLCLSSQQS